MHTIARNSLLAGAAISLLVGVAGAAEAATVTQLFRVNVESGEFAGQTFNGTYTFDTDDLASPTFNGVLDASQFELSFDFFDQTFTTDDDIFFTPFLSLTGFGSFVGLDFIVDAFDDAGAQIGGFDFAGTDFAYFQGDFFAQTDSGVGTVDVPEPGSVLALGVLGLGAVFGYKSRKAA